MHKFELSVVFCGLALTALSSCKPKAETQNEAQDASMGLAQHVFYRCSTATVQKNVKYSYELSALNNTTQEISLQREASNSPTLEFSELRKIKTDQWMENQKNWVNLVSKKDGSKGLVVRDYELNATINPENSFCHIVCTGPTKFVDGRCLWTGITEESVIGNMIIETVATAGLGTVWRVATLSRSAGAAGAGAKALIDGKSTMLVLDSPLRTGAQRIATAKTFDEAIAQMSKSLQRTNPLSGTPAVGKGNCANDAMTQLVSLVLGRWACAIPYPKGKLLYATQKGITDDLTKLVGVKESFKGIDDLVGFSTTTLAQKMADGDVALLLSRGTNGAHATLVAKLKGNLVHINNQNWPQKFQSLGEWDSTWRATFGGPGTQYQVYLTAKKIIGFQ